MAKLPNEVISLDVHFKKGIEDISIEYFNYVMTLYDTYRSHGVMPYPGSLSDQPAKIIEIFNTLEQLTIEREQRQLDEQQREQKRLERKRK